MLRTAPTRLAGGYTQVISGPEGFDAQVVAVAVAVYVPAAAAHSEVLFSDPLDVSLTVVGTYAKFDVALHVGAAGAANVNVRNPEEAPTSL